MNVIIPTSGGLYSPEKQKYKKEKKEKINLMDVFNVFRNIQTNKQTYLFSLPPLVTPVWEKARYASHGSAHFLAENFSH